MSTTSNAQLQPVDKGSFGWAVLGFFLPIVGLILWLVWKDTRPLDSRRSRNGFIVGLIVSVVFTIIYSIFAASMLASMTAHP